MEYNLNDRKFTKNKFIRVCCDVVVDMYTFIENTYYSLVDNRYVYIGINNLYDELYIAFVYSIYDDLMVVTKDYMLIDIRYLDGFILSNSYDEIEDYIKKSHDYLIYVDKNGFKFVEGEK